MALQPRSHWGTAALGVGVHLALSAALGSLAVASAPSKRPGLNQDKAYEKRVRVKERADRYLNSRALRTEERFMPYCSTVTRLRVILLNKSPDLAEKRAEELPGAKRDVETMFEKYARDLGGAKGWQFVRAAVVSAYNNDPSIGMVLLEDLYLRFDNAKGSLAERHSNVLGYLAELGQNHGFEALDVVDELLGMSTRKVETPRFANLPMHVEPFEIGPLDLQKIESKQNGATKDKATAKGQREEGSGDKKREAAADDGSEKKP